MKQVMEDDRNDQDDAATDSSSLHSAQNTQIQNTVVLRAWFGQQSMAFTCYGICYSSSKVAETWHECPCALSGDCRLALR